MASTKTIEEALDAPQFGIGSSRKPAGFWEDPQMIDQAYDYSKKKHGKVTKEVLISDHGSGVYHAIERLYQKYNLYLIQRGEKVNQDKSGLINKKRRKKKKAFDPTAEDEEGIDYTKEKEVWSFKDACEGYKLLRRDSREPISEKDYREYYGRVALSSAMRMGSYLKFQEFNEKKRLEERLKG